MRTNNHNIILGIETSCDETALALYGQDGLIADVLYSQIDSHQVYGGVVPELAAREHLSKINPLLDTLLAQAGISIHDITHIAYTRGPGLIGALLVGANYASALALGLGRPLIGVNHLEAHIVSPFINKQLPEQPFLTLLVSGGHTQIILTHGLGRHEIIGESLDDAVGEAFDKTAKIMGLGYPGGPIIEQTAKHATKTIDLPRPMTRKADAMMSFSGLKTATRLAYQKNKDEDNIRANIAHSLQEAICDTVIQKVKYAIKKTQVEHLVVSGGVSANQYLRQALKQLPLQVDFPPLEYCTDNAAMVAFLGYLRSGDPAPKTLAQARWRVDDI
ncbi:tRNA (adenosine(37)-N6)-threonylcarbamoyltransferase complex transferase subunit TsaD [Candidatus Synchoanobacter obligatus]|uniref:tRNA N6-adenosine threonylcarbamoyltransferase n=1 Tax=Candidatus Synchoanobacter obligatus TaxID=2919597 RepID=A0ABT1L4F5_9GAMM|nr:tRNA (adenosine(37)-N6)-threonylcarbamoyltransferase complex transferase subunit TsaD [Candidatus Synchoanobacter obligatus]MCP8351811.1 tRNA (adenosine(37)-N6)-threonylcarbamoyltransferase complex transferase subunit TsaD [Candidatus Synchoanobacter obligatus]